MKKKVFREKYREEIEEIAENFEIPEEVVAEFLDAKDEEIASKKVEDAEMPVTEPKKRGRKKSVKSDK